MIIKELGRREFWNQISYHFRDDFIEKEFLEKRRGLIWENDMEKLQAWKEGRT